MVFSRCTGRLPNNTQKQLLEICHFRVRCFLPLKKEETLKQKKKEKEKCENVPLQTPLGSAVSRGGSMGRLCVSWLHLMTVFTTLVQCRRIHLLIFSCKGPIDTWIFNDTLLLLLRPRRYFYLNKDNEEDWVGVAAGLITHLTAYRLMTVYPVLSAYISWRLRPLLEENQVKPFSSHRLRSDTNKLNGRWWLRFKDNSRAPMSLHWNISR